MSLINQMLLDLEKRRASGADRGVLPDHVRALPETRSGSGAWLMAALGGLAAAAFAAWMISSGSGFPGSKQALPVITPLAVSSSENKVVEVAAQSGTTLDAQPREDVAASAGTSSDPQSAGRLSLELSNAPAAVTEKPQPILDKLPEPKAPISTAQVLAKAQPEAAPAVAWSSPGASSVVSPAIAQAPAQPETKARQQAAPAKAVEPLPKTPDAAATKPAAASPQAARPEIEKQVRQPTARQLAENEYGKATSLLHQGRLTEAREGFEAALHHHPEYVGARQALFGLLIEAKSYSEAERVLQEGLQLNPAQTGFAMALARLQVDRGNNQAAADTLQKTIAHAQNNAEYLAFLAALLQRQQRHYEAVEQFQAALSLKPQSGIWLMGLGMSLQELNRNSEALEAFHRAKASGNLNPDLQAFADQRLRQLQ